MSHYPVVVCLPPMQRIEVRDALTAALEPFDENKEVEQVIDADDGSTYWRNPQAKWDWWVIGGRWRGYFLPRSIPSVRDRPALLSVMSNLVYGESGSFGNEALETTAIDGGKWWRPDGGRIAHLDFEAMRGESALRAARDWDEYAAVVGGTPVPTPWSEFRTRVELAEAAAPLSWDEYVELADSQALAAVGLASREDAKALEYGTDRYKRYFEARSKALDSARVRYWDSLEYSIERARVDYAAQPRIAVLRKHPTYRGWFDGPEDSFELPRDEYVLQEAARAVPGYGTLRQDGRWLAPGRMGWFGMSDDDPDSFAYYSREANAYLDGLGEDDWVVCVDAHI